LVSEFHCAGSTRLRPPGGEGHGVLGGRSICASRLGGKKLHVSSVETVLYWHQLITKTYNK